MLYRITYRRRSDRDNKKWTEFREVLGLEELTSCLKWLEKKSDNHELISVIPFKQVLATTNTRFNKLWEILHKQGYVRFTDYGETCTLYLVPSRYGEDVSLRSEDGNVVLCHWQKERFKNILVDKVNHRPQEGYKHDTGEKG